MTIQYCLTQRKNLLKKYQAFYGKLPENTDFEMKNIGRYRERFVIYKKDFIVKRNLYTLYICTNIYLLY